MLNNDMYDSLDPSYFADYNAGSVLIITAIIKAVEYLLISAAMYFGCVYITKNKLNLE